MVRVVAKTGLLFCIALHASAQQNETPAHSTPSTPEEPEEIVIVGQRVVRQLRMQMIDAERAAYDIFNRFNDERRFHISCSMHQPTGTHFERQVCLPIFQTEATAAHGQAFLQDYRNLSLQYECPSCPVIAGAGTARPIPQEMVIASQLKEYRLKMEQVAKEHPEFLEAIIRYGKIKARYAEATGTGEK